MATLLHLGIGLAGIGLVLAHVVLGLSRKGKKDGEPLARSYQILMWTSLALFVAGLVCGTLGFLYGGRSL